VGDWNLVQGGIGLMPHPGRQRVLEPKGDALEPRLVCTRAHLRSGLVVGVLECRCAQAFLLVHSSSSTMGSILVLPVASQNAF
jgi:hypothetical protein